LLAGGPLGQRIGPADQTHQAAAYGQDEKYGQKPAATAGAWDAGRPSPVSLVVTLDPGLELWLLIVSRDERACAIVVDTVLLFGQRARAIVVDTIQLFGHCCSGRAQAVESWLRIRG
jgi:hypothetical protein